MKILLTTYFGLKAGGGIATATMMLTSELIKAGHEVWLAAAELNEFAQNLTSQLTPAQQQRLHWLKLPKVRGIISLPQRDKVLAQRLNIFFKKNKVDLVHVTDVRYLAVPSIQMAKKWQTPVVVDYRDYWWCCLKGDLLYQNQTLCDGWQKGKCQRCLSATKPGVKKIWVNQKFDYSQRKLIILKEANFNLPVSQCVAKKMVDFGFEPQRIQVMYDSLTPPAKISPQARIEIENQYQLKNKKVILFVGRLIYHRGIQTILETAKYLRWRNPEIMIVMVGDGELRAEILKTKEQWQLDNLKLTGQIPPEQVAAFYQIATVFFFPSQLDEPFSRAVLEAVFAGLPVVTSNLGGLPEIITDQKNGFLVEPTATLDFARQLEQIVNNEAMQKRMRLNNLTLSKKFTIDKYLKKLLAVYQQVSQHEKS